MSGDNTNATGLEIAVIGLSGKFPGADDVTAFWENIRNGIESIRSLNDDELSAAGVDQALMNNPRYVKAGGFLRGVKEFDAAFFDYTPREAQLMDPQYRLLHECVWEALEDAGYQPYQHEALIGLYAGASNNIFWSATALQSLKETAELFQAMLLNDHNFTTRISYKLDLRGPSLAMNTACSSSLVAIHLACQALLSGETDIAIAGGVSINMPTSAGYLYQEGMIHSPDGHCRAFDAQAAGTVFCDGAGMVVLKRLEEAVNDRDHIYAVIRGSAMNNDGNQKAGYTAPSTQGQTAVIKAALHVAEVEPESISYVEAHGTGTVLGDPIEIEALKAAYQTEKRGYCQIGSVKSNVGHLDAASGVAGFIKTVLALQQRQIPPSLHYEQPNPRIDFAHSPFVVATRLQSWLTEGGPRRAGVSSFGIGGTNAHVILEEAPALSVSGPSRPWQLLPLSARTETALPQVIIRLKQHLEDHPELVLADVAHTLQVGRAHFSHRRALVCSSVAEAMAALDEALHMPEQPRKRAQKTPAIAFLFPGQGSQYVNMGRELYEQEAVFRAVMDDCFARAEAYGLPELKAVLYPAQESAEMQERLTHTELAQPALFSVEYALAQLLISWGLRPHSLLGHSLGEYVAACLAGVLTLEDALKMVIRHSQIMGRVRPGEMVNEVELAQFEREVQRVSFAEPRIPTLSSVTGEWAQAKEIATPGYWVQQMRAVSQSMPPLLEHESVVLVLGRGEDIRSSVPESLMILGNEDREQAHLLTVVGRLWEIGLEIDWTAFSQNEQRHRLSLPTYPFERQIFWDVMTRSDTILENKEEPSTRLSNRETAYLETVSAMVRDHSATVFSETITEIVKSHFGLTEIDSRDNFFDLGATSLDISQLCSLLSEKLGQEIPLVSFYTYPSIRALANHLSLSTDTKDGTAASTTPPHPHSAQPASPLAPSGVRTRDIAVIGMSGRFPGASNVQAFWQNIAHAVETISWFSSEELEEVGIPREVAELPAYVKAKGIIGGVEYFDANFFDYAAKEAEIMDPQFRLLHECAWEALEDAGYDPGTYEGLIGVYSGTSPNLEWMYRLGEKLTGANQFGTMLLNDREFFSTALSYKLNLRGPSVTMQTACSTSLVTIVLACQSLLAGASDIALAGGVTVTLPEKSGYLYQEGMIHSPDGHCRSFDARAVGTVFGDGAGMVVLKRLEEAVKDRDHIYAVIRGSAMNNDGNQKVGYTAPSTQGQTAVIQAALRMAEVEPESISYVEAHGTGTVMGDPIEIAALTAAFQTEKRGYCQIGSVKSNVGHLDAASGVAGFIKTVLALQQRQIPPSLHYEQPNPQIDFAHSPFVVATRLQPWLTEGGPRRAGVSSFGIGGTNAHVILEEAPALSASGPSRPWQLLPLSARTETALPQVITRLRQHLETHPELVLADVAHTLQVGRAHFAHRRALVCSSVAEAMAALDEALYTPELPRKRPQKTPPIAFLFPGQGSQYVNMGRELYEQEAVFQAVMDDCFVRAEALGLSELKAVLYPAQESPEAQERLTRTELAQPALFSVEYALAQLLISWGLRPHSLLGHSLGEYVAACLAGVLTLEDALRLVIRRGQLMGQAQPGVMVSVSLSEGELQPYLQGQLSLAASNAPELCVVAGSASEIEALEERLQQDGRRFRRLQTSHAFHSALMEPILASFEQEVRQVTLSEPRLPYLSNLTGGWIQAQEATSARYWVQHVRQTVRFGQGIDQLFENEDTILIEVGPGTTLSTFARKSQRATRESVIINLLRHPQDQQPEAACLLKGIGRLWEAGVDLEWSKLLRSEQRQRLSLPTYPFERQRFWLESGAPHEERLSLKKNLSTQKNTTISEWFYQPSWVRSMLPSSQEAAPITHCLLFQDTSDLCESLIEQLMSHGIQIIRVETGARYTQVQQNHYRLNPHSANDYKVLFNDLATANKRPEIIIHLWSRVAPASLSFEEVQMPGYYSLIYLAQSIGAQKNEKTIKIAVITRDLVEITGQEQLTPEKSTIFGPLKVIPQEYTNIQCKMIDVDYPAGQTAAPFAGRIIEECLTWSSDAQVAYRGKHRWIQEFRSVHLEKSQKPLLRTHGVYLLIGGLGGIGLTMARYLAKQYQARLILTRKSWFPAQADWEQWVREHDEHDDISRKICALRELEHYGAEVSVAQVDIAHENDVQLVINEIEARYQTLHGVVHSAGLPGGDTFRAIQEITHEAAEAQFTAKIQGVQVLQRILQGKQLDFCLLFSSVATALGGLGFCSYTAANQYLDTFVQRQNQTDGPPWLCINWDAWAFLEGVDTSTAFGQSIIATAIVPDQEGEELFQQILTSRFESQLFVSTTDLNERIRTWIHGTGERQRERQNTASFARPDLANPYIEPKSDMEMKLVELWKDFFRIEQVGVRDNFFELGASSLDAIQITRLLQEKLKRNIPIVTIFTYPTIALLASFLVSDVDQETDHAIQQEELVEGRQRVAGRRSRRMQEDE
ncbi:type I polyketide synthase [Tengunoibacter tsumagoiensis]|uniref:Polyketide synthase n=1 Tax=Tengunoibacter tsumagoiensis TaxID=2014871 RepID=A0A402A9A2_9CHLR|nr:type I polyketide synthase [Tengunoibacter tsumagoiensis]GCE15723.1 hypothetical protein KTT_55820 [Tengunoibacter tsumagoiensis]